jgi:S1-C subfamily serine protease
VRFLRLPSGLLVAGAILALVAVGLPLGACGSGKGNPKGDGSSTTSSSSAAASAPPSNGDGSGAGASSGAGLGAVAGIYRHLEPSVVAVLVKTPNGGAEGSGVAWDKDTIVTNHHVIADAQAVEVALATGRRVPATVQASDARTDLAILSLKGVDLPPAQFAKNLPPVGSLAVAIGNPLGFESSVTAGVVSGVDRSIPSGGQTPSLVGLVQTDAAISPGNSGGALVGPQGKVIGINVAYIPPQARAVSIGFAIPAPVVTDIVGQLIENGHAVHPFLGTQLRPLSPQAAAQLGLGVDAGVIVLGVENGGPAADAGLRPGDVIVGMGGKPVRAVEDVLAALRGRDPGQRLKVTYVRDGDRHSTTVKLGARP